jgi:hypothetical protein
MRLQHEGPRRTTIRRPFCRTSAAVVAVPAWDRPAGSLTACSGPLLPLGLLCQACGIAPCYLLDENVLDLKDIMRKNWMLFEPHFAQADRKGAKDKVLGFVVSTPQAVGAATMIGKASATLGYRHPRDMRVRTCRATISELLVGSSRRDYLKEIVAPWI